MIRDLNTFAATGVIDTDLCIIGAGAVGITLARALSSTKRRVLLLESGGLDSDTRTQSLYEGTSVGLPYFKLDAARLRYFGGTTNHWGGNCGVLTGFELSKRSWVSDSGWPIALAELLPYYQRAQAMLEIGPYAFDDGVWKLLGLAPPPLNSGKLTVRTLRRADTVVRFGQAFRADLVAAPRVDVALNANVAQIVPAENGRRIDGVELKTLGGRTATVRARDYVLACGGMENARLLLASNRVQRNGLGNGHDLVGRYFMDHPSIKLGDIFARQPKPVLDLIGDYRERRIGKVVVRPGPTLSDEWMQRSGSLSCRLLIGGPRPVSEGEERALPPALAAAAGDGPLMAWPVYTLQEQAPNPASRVSLTQQYDALGMPRIQLDWRLSQLDLTTVQTAARALGEEVGRLNAGRLRLEPWLAEGTSTWEGVVGQCHHIGTTRMSDHPGSGVVDRAGRVHGIENLYVGGSSVFPTGGSDNSTLTIVALALRLADHLK